MVHIKSWTDMMFDARDFTSALKNFVAHGIVPGTESEIKYFRQLNEYLFTIREYIEYYWAESDVQFSGNRVFINIGDNEIIVDSKDNWVSWCGHKLWVPKGKLQWLNNWIYEMRQKQLTVPGVYIPKE